jgi:hypothetical protein
MPLMFQTRKKPKGTTIDLFEETFGKPPNLSVPLGGEQNAALLREFSRKKQL